MRTYIQNPDRNQTGDKQRRRETHSNEWDIGLNLTVGNEKASALAIQAYAEAQCKTPENMIRYLLISGIEYTDQTKEKDNTTKGNPHVHVALITKKPINRAQALSLVRPVKMGPKEYARTRPPTWSYYGWRVHHLKEMTKVNPVERMLYEFDQLPDDDWTNAKIVACGKVVLSYGTDEDKQNWATYRTTIRGDINEEKKKELEMFEKVERSKEEYERNKMLMEDIWEVNRMREDAKEYNRACDEYLGDQEKQEKLIKMRTEKQIYFISKARKLKRKRNQG